MAKRKKTKRKTKSSIFSFGSSRKKSKQAKGRRLRSIISTLKVFMVLCVLASGVVGFKFLERYAKSTAGVSEKTGLVTLIDVPEWVNGPLKEKIYAAATAYGEDLKLDEDAAVSVQQNIETLVVWLDNVRVWLSHDSILIEAKWRKPVAMIKVGMKKFYVDSDFVVLDFVSELGLPIVEVKGLSGVRRLQPGDVLDLDDLDAAMTLLGQLGLMDKLVTPDKPLLYEIDRVDVSNFNGRQNSRASHIILYAKDNTEIIWGAEIGTWQRYLEATDEEKLTSLYAYYKEYGSLLNGVKYINLQYSQDKISQPVDKY